MIIDARALTADHRLESDLCIIGAGVVGISLAMELRNAGFDICLLESGGTGADAKTQSLCRGDNIGLDYYPLDTARVRQFGGSSHKWLLDLGEHHQGARLRPMSAIDFEKRDWVPYSGWPFDKAHLDPYYDRALNTCQVREKSWAPSDWETTDDSRRFPFALGRIDSGIYHTVDRSVFCRDHPETLGNAPNVKVVLHATALEILTDETGTRATRVRACDPEGKEFSVSAQRFVTAIGGLETPRLLLLSNTIQKHGLGNDNDLVGRFFMEHPHLWSGGIIPNDRNVFKKADFYKVHRVRDSRVISQLTLSDDTIRTHRMLNYSAILAPASRLRPQNMQRASTSGIRSVGNAARALAQGDLNQFSRHLSSLVPVVNELSIKAYGKFMKAAHRLFESRYETVFLLNHMAEQIPNPDSRVMLGTELDAFGQRRLRLDWRLDEQDIQSIVRAQYILDEEVRRTGFGHVRIDLTDNRPPPGTHGGWHHMGTTRMHTDAKQGVVDEQCRIHGMDNLYIAGPSLFPTGGCANPTLTAIALAIRLADHLKETRAR